jgi:hypothetical protein
MIYTPCQSLCDKEADICPGCNRSREEINTVKEIVQLAVSLGLEKDYTNIDEFADSIAAKIKKKIRVQQQIRRIKENR